MTPSRKSTGTACSWTESGPRGVKKKNLALNAWQKELATSTELRKWFGHNPQRWIAFYQRYHIELQ